MVAGSPLLVEVLREFPEVDVAVAVEVDLADEPSEPSSELTVFLVVMLRPCVARRAVSCGDSVCYQCNSEAEQCQCTNVKRAYEVVVTYSDCQCLTTLSPRIAVRIPLALRARPGRLIRRGVDSTHLLSHQNVSLCGS